MTYLRINLKTVSGNLGPGPYHTDDIFKVMGSKFKVTDNNFW